MDGIAFCNKRHVLYTTNTHKADQFAHAQDHNGPACNWYIPIPHISNHTRQIDALCVLNAQHSQSSNVSAFVFSFNRSSTSL